MSAVWKRSLFPTTRGRRIRSHCVNHTSFNGFSMAILVRLMQNFA